MTLRNYSDISPPMTDDEAGFQFQFSCANCPKTWKSPLKPFRRGRIAGLIYNLSYLISGTQSAEAFGRRMAEGGVDEARQKALNEAQDQAANHFHECAGCDRGVCENCFDDGAGQCTQCALKERGGNGYGNAYSNGNGRQAGGAGAHGGATCSNCGCASQGGRFCPECGFDMASTHKSCPSCGSMAERGARFCTDCGHGF